MMAWRLPDDYLMTAWQLPNACLTTDWRLPDNFLMTARQLPDDCQTTALWLSDNCLMTAWRLPHDSLMTADDWWKPKKCQTCTRQLTYNQICLQLPDDLITAWQSNCGTYILYWFSWFLRTKIDQILTLCSLANWLAGTWLNCAI